MKSLLCPRQLKKRKEAEEPWESNEVNVRVECVYISFFPRVSLRSWVVNKKGNCLILYKAFSCPAELELSHISFLPTFFRPASYILCFFVFKSFKFNGEAKQGEKKHDALRSGS